MMKELVTAALPYANGTLHLGHLMSTYLPADVYARYCRLRGRETAFICATDEHGTAIEINAEKAGKPPQEFVAEFHEQQLKDFKSALIEFDEFHHTDSPENHELTREFHEKLGEYFYEKEITQTYCPKCERVLPDRYVKGKCPNCGAEDQYGDGCEKCGKTYSTSDLLEPRCAVCGTTPEHRSSKHLFFCLTSFKDFLSKWFQENKELQRDVINYVKNWLPELQDWDVTRDGPYFGVPIPGRPNQYFYVWFDAPIGYVSSTKHHFKELGDWWSGGARISHFIGKDIIYHHYLFWPAMLKGAGFALPARIPTRGHLNMASGEKMSKSRGTLVTICEAVQKTDPEYLRYYLTAITPNSTADINFSWDELKTKTNNELIDAYGNLVYRVLSFAYSKTNGVPEKSVEKNEDKEFEAKIPRFLQEAANHYDAVELKRSLESCMAFAGECNKYFNDRAPWKLLKEKPEEAKTVLHNACRAVYVLSVALHPVLPASTKKVFAWLNEEPKWEDCLTVRQINKPEVLYQKIEY
ncbi:methionine--tRNA ligase [Candidatus Micrarchaeota archaeon CG_4_10_14_0_2_um_filter_55_9]|nr:MAG: methionine--tRNA ligase [Candidatus Micrarchaeota archaeon CG_4_10_14_0_2_um_filter_55_9]